jgi:hypothetical protein
MRREALRNAKPDVIRPNGEGMVIEKGVVSCFYECMGGVARHQLPSRATKGFYAFV